MSEHRLLVRWLAVLRPAAGPLAVAAVGLFVLGLVGAAVTPVVGDTAVLSALAAARSPALTTAAHVVTRLGDLWVVVAVAVVVALAVRHRVSAPRAHAVLLLSIAGSMVVVGLLKLVIGRARPAEALVPAFSPAYPSGHAARAAVLCGLLVWGCRHIGHRGLRVAALVVAVSTAVAIAASRVYLGVHLPTEVIAGAALGGAWVVAVLRLTASPGPARADADD